MGFIIFFSKSQLCEFKDDVVSLLPCPHRTRPRAAHTVGAQEILMVWLTWAPWSRTVVLKVRPLAGSSHSTWDPLRNVNSGIHPRPRGVGPLLLLQAFQAVLCMPKFRTSGIKE